MPLTQAEARNQVHILCSQAYSAEVLRAFVANAFPQSEQFETKPSSGKYIPDNFKDDITSYQRLAKCELPDSNRLDVLHVKLKSPAKLFRARFMQRNFISRYLNGGYDGTEKDAALVAFTADGVDDWRLSLVYKKYIFDELGVRSMLSEPRRCSFLVGPSEGTHTAEQQLASALASATPLTLESLEQAFQVEPVEKAFFTEYKGLYDNLLQALTETITQSSTLEAEFSSKTISYTDFAKRLLGQLVFLYFLQRKGWLGVAKQGRWGEGSPKWLSNFFTEHCNTNQADNRFFNDCLEPLFYDALARDRSQDNHWHDILQCRIPFLNGGLFEPLGVSGGYDWQSTEILLPNSIFEEIFSVFDRYNFTVVEDEPLDKEVAVDPEMLGKVFENLLEVEERGKLGTFYTPRHIVQYMCRESLVCHLDKAINTQWVLENPQTTPTQTMLLPSTTTNTQMQLTVKPRPKRVERVSKEDIEIFIRADEIVEEALSKNARKKTAQNRSAESIRPLPQTILQFAEEIDDALASVTICDPAIGSGAFCVGMMQEIVRARTTLAEGANTAKLTPYELKRHAIQHSLYGVDIDPSAVDIAKLRLWLSLVVDEEDYDSIKPLPNLDYRIMTGNSVDFAEDNYVSSLFFNTLTDAQNKFFHVTDQVEKLKLRQTIEDARKHMGCNNAFDWLMDFHNVLASSKNEHLRGFDIVIANPPYVRQEKIKEYKARLKTVFGNFFCGTADLYTYFYALSLQKLLKPFGYCCFIAPNKFFRAGYGKNLRTLLTSGHARVRRVIDFGDMGIFAEATTYPSIVVAQRASTGAKTKVLAATIKDGGAVRNLWHYLQKHSLEIPPSQLSSDGWSLEDPATQALLDKIRSQGTPLGELVNGKMYRGILTGLNEAFVIDGATKDKLIAEDAKSAELIKPWLRGRDLTKWRAENAGLFLIHIPSGGNHPWPWTGKEATQAEEIFANTYPAIYAHFEQFRQKLIDRADQGQYFWELRACAYDDEFAKPKIIWPDMTQKMRACFDASGAFCANTGYIYATENMTILAILQSNAFHFFAQQSFAVFQGNTFRFIAQYMETVPIPKATAAQEKQLSELVQYILKQKDADPDADVSKQEQLIDDLVCDLYNLTNDEKKMILARNL